MGAVVVVENVVWKSVLKCVFFVWVEMSFLEKEDVVAFGNLFDIGYNVAIARALDLGGGIVGEGVEIVSNTGGGGEEGGGGTAWGGERHWIRRRRRIPERDSS